ncbi:MAG: ATP synthase F1 subunit gamma [Ruminococcus sp.]|nr:ATP synthase F1 subunit gamma [Ruminococcus sp.]
MSNMHEIKERIKSVSDIKKITNAMYLISSSKLKKARKDLDATEPYFDKLLYAMRSILSRVPDEADELVFFDRRTHIPPENRSKLLIVITADKGMCGAYNHNVIEKAESMISKTGMNYLSVMGQVGRMYFQRHDKKENVTLDKSFFYTTQNPTLYRARSIAEEIMERFQKGEVDDVYVVYTDMKSSSEFEVRVQQILPLDVTHFVKSDKDITKHHEAEFYPNIEAVMRHLIPNFMKGLIYGAMVESFCSEQQARMSAMDSATTSAKDMLHTLSLQYNRARQAAITQEITEICSGSEAQSSGGNF